MFSRATKHFAFTLLEVVVATMIVGLLSLTLYRFLSGHLKVMHLATDLDDTRAANEAVVHLLASQLKDLPRLSEPGNLEGRPNKFHGLSNDEITWRCGAGPGLLTAAADGLFRVTLTVQPVDERSAETELGLRRRPADPRNSAALESTRGSGDQQYNWLPLLRPVAALEIRYYDSAAHSWVESWTAPDRYPGLVRVRLWRQPDSIPVETVLTVPTAHVTL